MAADISVKLAVEGEKTFKTAVKAADSQIKALDAELKAAVSGFDGMTSAEDKAAKKSDILTKQIEAQKSKLDVLTKQHDKATAKLEELADALEKAKQEHGEDSAEAQKAANAYNRQVTEVANLERQMNQTNAAINQETADLKKLENGVDEVSDEMVDASEETSRFGDVLKANLTGTAIVDAAKKLGETIVNLAKDVAAYGDEVGDNAAKMGISTKAYQEWDAILQRNGSSIDAMKTSMKTLSSAAQTGKEAFEKLGISQKELSELSTEDLFAKTVEGLQNMEAGTERTYIASQLLGKGAQELGSVLDMTADETDDLRKQIRDLGGIMDEKAIKASDEFMDSTQNLKDAFNGLARDVMSDALPVMTNLVTALTNGITKFKEFRNLGKSSNASGLKDLIANVAEWNEKLHDSEAAIDALGWDGAQAAMMEYTRALGNAQEQLLDYVATEEGQLEVLNLLQSGEMTMQEVMDATGWSYSQVIGYMRDAADAQRDAAAAADEETTELSEEEIAAQELTDKLQGLVKETSFAAKGNGDLREEYERLKAEIDACSDVEDEHLQELARIALETLNLNATNQELSKSYPGIVNAANRAGITLQSLSKYIIDNGLTAEQWASKCKTATDGVINSFQETKTSLGLSLDEMRANLEHNIEAQQSWNDNIATLMAAAAESGNEGAVAFVQYMSDLGVGAADEVAKMVEDVDGTLDTFGPLFEEAADAGMTSVIQGIEGQKIEVTGSFTGMITDGVEAMTEEAGTAEAAGQEVASAAKTGAESVDFSPVGTQMDAGIVKGIYQNEGSVKTAMTLVARRAVASAKAELQIKSPSRVFRDEVGQMITEGLALGIEDDAALRDLVSATQTVANTLVGSFNDMDKLSANVDLVGTTQPQVADDIYSAVGGAVNGINSAMSGMQILIPLQVTLDGRVIAETTFDDLVLYANANGTPIINAV